MVTYDQVPLLACPCCVLCAIRRVYCRSLVHCTFVTCAFMCVSDTVYMAESDISP